ncbi:SDR family NAD(P)-dependent oxidoreductase [Streptomyces sp. NPDC054933]
MRRPFQPVAIVAATCILPGAPELDDLWRAFDEETTAIGPVPDDWLDRSVYYSPDRRARNRSYSQTAALLSPWEFTRPPRLPPKQAARLDPAHRLALETGQRIVDTLQDAWLPREKTGVWVANNCGTFGNTIQMIGYLSSERWARRAAALEPELAAAVEEFQQSYRKRNPHPREDGSNNSNILSGRIANHFDLRGQQMSVDAACASSMAALRNACLSLEDGSVDMALVASIGTLSTEQMVINAKARSIAPGPSFPFDAAADGFVPGEGAVMVALVRAEDAERRGLRTLGVLRSIGVSLNGRGTAPWSPSEAAERLAITRAWEEGEFSPDGNDGQIDYIEAHGTATAVGDRTEHSAMLATYGKAAHNGPIPFGSVKSVIGHTVETAGLAGLLRALYVFDRGRVPANVGVREPAEYVALHADRLRLSRQGEPLAPVGGRPRRVAVSSFGVGGINYHAIVESGLEPGKAIHRTPPSREPVAVIGASAIMPQAPDIDAVWEQLDSGTAPRMPLSEYIGDFGIFHHPDVSHRDRTVCPASAVVDRPLLSEPARWRVLPKIADTLCTDHLLLLNAASQLVGQNVVPVSAETRSRSGVYITDIMDGDSRHGLLATIIFERWWNALRGELAARPGVGADTLDRIEQSLRGDETLGIRAVTQDDSVSGLGVQGAARVAAGLDLGGAAVAVNSACASGLAALSMAMQELRAGTLDFALVGGASLALDEVNQVALSAIGSLSASGQGQPYDECADGFVIGSGATWFALKRLTDAERDGDRVLAVIRECVGSSDGKGRSLLAPSRDGRRKVLERTFAKAGIDPLTVQYVEGHGAANVLGDSSELEAVGRAMGTVDNPVRVGSIKGNYGHLKGPAALAGLMKVVLCLRERTLVPTAGFRRRGELPGVDDRLVQVVDARTAWPDNGAEPRRGAVNAFGLGGTNFHAVVEEYRPQAQGRDEARSPMLRVTADTPEELARRLAGAQPPMPSDDDGSEESEEGGQWRAALFVRGAKAERAGRAVLAARVAANSAGTPCEITDLGAWSGPQARKGPVVALFPGQSGAQHFDSVAWLAARTAYGQTALKEVEEALGAPGRTVRTALTDGSIEALGDLRSRSGTSQVLGLLSSYLVWRWFDDRTDTPVAALGHSAGEFAALVAAGCLRFGDAVRLCWQRGAFAEEAAARGHRGLMAAVFAGPERLQPLLDAVPDAYLGTVNGPRFCVIAGWADAVRQVLSRGRADGIESTELDIGMPFHTPLLSGAVAPLRALLAELPVSRPRLPVYSAVLDGPYPQHVDPEAIRDAVAALYTEPVRLDRMLDHAARAGARRFVECGTGRSLSRSVDAALTAHPHLALAGVTSPAEGLDRLETGLWVAGLTRATRPMQASVPTPSVVTALRARDTSGRRSAPARAEAVPKTPAPASTRPATATEAAPVRGAAEGAVAPAGRRANTPIAVPQRATSVAHAKAAPAAKAASATTAPTPATVASPAVVGDFRLFTPVAVKGPAYAGEPWRGASVVVATARGVGLAAELARELSAAGARVEALEVAELTGGQPCETPATVEQLAQQLRQEAGPHWLVWVSASPGAPEPLSGSDGGRAMAELSCLRAAVRGLVEGWDEHGAGGLLLVTGTDGRFGDSRSLIDPLGGALAGFARALSREYPQAGIALADLGRDVRPAAAAARITGLGRPPAGHHDVGLSSDAEWTTELTALPVTGTPTSGAGLLDALREPDAAMVVSGGTTGIVAHILCAAAERLSGPLPGRLVLISRTAPADEPVPDLAAALARLGSEKGARLIAWRRANPGRTLHEFESAWKRTLYAVEARATLTRLAAAGVRAEHAVVDVCAGRQVRAFAERLRLDGLAIRTVVHGAGIERSSRIIDKPVAEWEATAAVKITGFHHLVAAAGDDLRRVLAHGSVSGSLGLPGQTDYSAANEYLAMAVCRLRAERPGVVAQYIGWPAWDDIGLAADPAVKRKLEGGMGLRYLPPEQGAEWAAVLAEQADTLPSHLVLIPVPLPPSFGARAVWQHTPGERWWLVDTVSWDGRTARVRRQFDTADPRDAELGDHRVRDNIRIAGVQIVEMLAEAFVATVPSVPGRLELRDIDLRQGLVTGTDGRRPATVAVEHADDGTARLRLETTPLLRGGFPGPGAVLLATAVAGAAAPEPARPPVDVSLVRPVADPPDPIELAKQFGIGYGGRFAAVVTALDHPDFDAAGRFTAAPPPARVGRYLSDPATLDIAVRTVTAAAWNSGGERGLPSAIGRVVLHPRTDAGGAGRDRYVFVTTRQEGGYDVLLTDPLGRPLACVEGLRLRPPSDQPRSPVTTAPGDRGQ